MVKRNWVLGLVVFVLAGVLFSSKVDAAVPGAFSKDLTNETPICDLVAPVGPAVQLNWGVAPGTTAYHVYRNGAYYVKVNLDTFFYNNANVFAGQSYKYQIVAENSDGITKSNEITVDILSNICDSSEPPSSQCSDGIDNDGDGKIDFPQDPGCLSDEDDAEFDSERITISDDSTGEDCALVGIWDGVSKKCTLNRDVLNQVIYISDDGITIDGNGHKIEATGDFGYILNEHGAGGREGVNIFGSDVTVENLHIDGFMVGVNSFEGGVVLRNNTISNNYSGTSIMGSGNVVSGNKFEKNKWEGLSLHDADHCLIENNIVEETYYRYEADGGTEYANGNGIFVVGSHNTIRNNAVRNNVKGLLLSTSAGGNTLSSNVMSDNEQNFTFSAYDDGEGVSFEDEIDTALNNDIDKSNLTDGKKIYYLKDVADQVFDGTSDIGTFICVRCNNVTLKNLDLSKNGVGIAFWKTTNSKIEQSNMHDNNSGVELNYSSNNRIKDISVKNNEEDGIFLDYDSDANTFSGITAENNNAGIFTTGGENIRITDSSFKYNRYVGIRVDNSTDSILVYNNNFDNVGAEFDVEFYYGDDEIAEPVPAGVRFYNNLPEGGNHWGAYDEPSEGCLDLDNNGICDAPYVKNDVVDNFPWVKENGWGGGSALPQCSDGIDNDGDGLLDINDPGCHSDGNAFNQNTFNAEDDDENNTTDLYLYKPIFPEYQFVNLTNKKNIIVITHGYNSDDKAWVNGLKEEMKKPGKIENVDDWDIITYDWSDDAKALGNTGFWGTFVPGKYFYDISPYHAYNMAENHGKSLGQQLAKINPEKIHFIAHSAGSNLIQNASETVMDEMTKNGLTKPTTHMTFLDAFTPGIFEVYGKDVAYAEQYVDTRKLPMTETRLPYAINYNVTKVGEDLQWYDILGAHAWPIEYYSQSIEKSFLPGYPFSLESGKGIFPITKKNEWCDIAGNSPVYTSSCHTKGDFAFDTISGMPKAYWETVAQPGGELLTSGIILIKDVTLALGDIYWETVARPGGEALLKSVTGVVDIVDGSMFFYNEYNKYALKLITGSPAWATIEVRTEEESNNLSFDYIFMKRDHGDGIFSVFVDETLVFHRDEALLDSMRIYNEIRMFPGTLSPGKHKITFRLDSESEKKSEILISNIELQKISLKEYTDSLSPKTFIIASDANWQNTDVKVTLSATDNENGVGVQKTEYSLDGGETWVKYSEPFTISEEGIHQIQYRSIDWFGNIEETKTATIKIDKTAPEAIVSPSAEDASIEVNGSDNLTDVGVDQKSPTEYILTDEAGNTTKLQFEGDKIKKGKGYDRNEQIRKWYANNSYWKKFFSRWGFGKETNLEVNAKLKSIQYNNKPVIKFPDNRLHFVWKTSKKELTTLSEQQIEVRGQFKIIGNYNEKKDETSISIHEKGRPKNERIEGLKILSIDTDKGILYYSY